MKTIAMKKNQIYQQVMPAGGLTEGAPGATGVSPPAGGGGVHNVLPDPEVPEKKPRRKFTARYKLQVLDEVNACTEQGQIGAFLRREGLYSSNLTSWRKQRKKGLLDALSPKKRGRKNKPKNPLTHRVAKLEQENRRLEQKLRQAEHIIEVQKKISEILGITQNLDENEGNDS